MTTEDFTYAVFVTFLVLLFTTSIRLYSKIHNQCKIAVAVTVKGEEAEAKDFTRRGGRGIDDGHLKKDTGNVPPARKEQETLPLDGKVQEDESTEKETYEQDGETWRCVCETGFLPPGLLKSFGGMESMIRMSTGQCYHKTP
jgi:hypothetical protein